jgi:signal transduction histidine kinase
LLIGFRDITDVKTKQKEIIRINKQLRSLAGYLQSVREEERNNIALNLHDELGQKLTAIQIDLGLLSKKVKSRSRVKLDKKIIEESLDNINVLLNDSIETIQNLVNLLKPKSLYEFGFWDTFKLFIREHKDKYDINFNVRSNFDDIELESNSSLALFRMIQEALTNIVRHSKAENVDIDIVIHKKNLNLKIIDDGIGFSKKKEASIKSLGIISMRERAMMLRGKFEIKSELKKGTSILVQIPVSQNIYRYKKDDKYIYC